MRYNPKLQIVDGEIELYSITGYVILGFFLVSIIITVLIQIFEHTIGIKTILVLAYGILMVHLAGTQSTNSSNKSIIPFVVHLLLFFSFFYYLYFNVSDEIFLRFGVYFIIAVNIYVAIFFPLGIWLGVRDKSRLEVKLKMSGTS